MPASSDSVPGQWAGAFSGTWSGSARATLSGGRTDEVMEEEEMADASSLAFGGTGSGETIAMARVLRDKDG